ncbi:unnamed protein product [Arabis nemorensis]|uniref:Uncharacterized protein n=1 Tax=Arabis nemorensis TaxID=586526 RepID=A0A565CH06_9BRAS|nr:unnamed protein product [Arabis nemorensis]
MEWREVKGLNGLSDSLNFISVANPNGGRRLTVWWVSYQKEGDGVLVSKIMIWCEISFERRSREELYGIMEWSKILYTLDRSETGGLISLYVFCHRDALILS